MPKPVRRFVGRVWNAIDYALACDAIGEDQPRCERCGQDLMWLPYEKRLICPTVAELEALK